MARDHWSRIGLEFSLIKSQFVIFHRSRANLSPLCLQVNKDIIPISSNIKYLGMHLNARLRWTKHINFLRTRSSKYVNILKWLVGRCWDISSLQAINFANATILAQLLWNAVYYTNASNSHFRVLDSIAVSAYKIALSLPRSASNKTCWALSAQPTFKRKITILCDKFILKSIQLKKIYYYKKK